MDMLLWTGINTFLALETISLDFDRAVFRESDPGWAFLRTSTATFDAIFSVAV